MKNALKYGLTLTFAGLLLWFSLSGIETPEGVSKREFIFGTWAEGNKFYLLLSGVLALFSHWLRAVRWRLLLEPLGYKVSAYSSFLAVLNSYFVNLAIPRGGELSRCVNLHRLERVPVNTALGTVIGERVIDMVFLVLCIGGAFLVEFDKLVDFFNQTALLGSGDTSSQLTGKLGFILGIAVGALVLFIPLFIFVFKAKEGVLFKLANVIREFLGGLRSGLTVIFRLKHRALFVLYSFGIWVMYYLMLYTVFLAFPQTSDLGMLAALSIFTIGGIAMVVPTPSGAGAYHVFVSSALILLYSIDAGKANAFAFIFHGWQTLVVIVVGAMGLFAIQQQVNAKKKLRMEEEASGAVKESMDVS